MTVEEVRSLFEKHQSNEFLQSDRIPAHIAPSRRPDLNAFILLDQLVRGHIRDIISGAEHDEIWLGVDIEEFAAVATEALIVTLLRCGVRYDETYNSLAMFV